MNWDFLQRYDESWIWRCTDRHAVSESTRNFAALEECMADASRHGYAARGHAQPAASTAPEDASKSSRGRDRPTAAKKTARPAPVRKTARPAR